MRTLASTSAVEWAVARNVDLVVTRTVFRPVLSAVPVVADGLQPLLQCIQDRHRSVPWHLAVVPTAHTGLPCFYMALRLSSMRTHVSRASHASFHLFSYEQPP